MVQNGAEWRIGSPFRPRSGRRGLKRRSGEKREGVVWLWVSTILKNRTDLHNLPLLIVDECNHFVEPDDRGLDVVIISKFNRRS